jgi:hypothetical protein
MKTAKKTKRRTPDPWKQFHAGTAATTGEPLWHKWDDKPGYWSGHLGHRTPLQLLRECQSTIRDLIKNHPNLNRYAK